jgi:hypothetical protein
VNKVHLATLLSVLATAVSSCVTTKGPTADVQVFTAPVDANVAAVRSVGVHVFEKDPNEAFSRSLETIIANVAITDKNQTRQNTVAVVGLDRTRSIGRQSVDPASLASAAKRLGVDAILTGEIVVSASDSRPYTSSKSVCAREVTKRDKKGNEYQECVSYRDVSIPCVKNTASVQVNYRLISSQGQVLSRKSAQARDEDDACEGKRIRPMATEGNFLERFAQNMGRNVGGPITPQATLLANVYGVVAQEIKDQLIPQQKTLKVEWLSDASGIKDAKTKDRFESAVKFAAGARADRACEMFREVYVSEQQSSALHYNAGLCDEIEGQIEAAQKKYLIADKMLREPNAIVSAALVRTQKQVRAMDDIAAKRPDLMDAPAVARSGAKKTVNPIVAGRAGIDAKILDTMKSERRVALVIGNNQYRNVAVLRNSAKDARDVEAALKSVGFNVISGFDLNHQQTLQLLNRFKANLRKGDVAVVYFAGHGISIENTNFLLPVDFQSSFGKTARTARSKALDIETTVAGMLKAAGARFSMIVADACREVPQLEAGTRSIKRGLNAPKTIATGTLIAYAAGAGQTADDGDGENGRFTANFLKAIKTPNVNIREAMEWVASAVSAETNGEQIPSVYAELTGEFYFAVQ